MQRVRDSARYGGPDVVVLHRVYRPLAVDHRDYAVIFVELREPFVVRGGRVSGRSEWGGAQWKGEIEIRKGDVEKR